MIKKNGKYWTCTECGGCTTNRRMSPALILHTDKCSFSVEEEPVSCKTKRFAIIESPYSGDIEENLRYLNLCIRDAYNRGYVPIASHKIYIPSLDDNSPTERRDGIGMGFMIGRSLAAVTETEILFYTDRGFSRGMCAALKYWTGLVRVRMTSIKGYQSPAKPRTKNTMQRINAKTWQLDYTDRTGGRAIRVHEAGESYVATGKTPDGHIHTTSQNGARSAFWKMVTKMKEQVIFPDTFSFPEGFLEGKDANIENDESNDNLEYSTISMGSDKDSDGAFED